MINFRLASPIGLITPVHDLGREDIRDVQSIIWSGKRDWRVPQGVQNVLFDVQTGFFETGRGGEEIVWACLKEASSSPPPPPLAQVCQTDCLDRVSARLFLEPGL